MREILFRGKRTYNREWIEGSLLKVTFNGETVYLIFGDCFSYNGNDVMALIHALVDPATVGQYTGLTDKNGKRIFDGDIVKIWGMSAGVNGLWRVVYSEVNHEWALERDPNYHHHHFSFSDLNGFHETCEIIGNIHDNPDLLEITP